MNIGIFDSGIGGLNFLKAIRKTLPKFDYIYFGDTKNVPYGNKTQNEIYNLTKAGIEFLFNKNCKIVILACNTSSSKALRKIQQEWLQKNYSDKKVLGVLIPIAEEAANRKDVRRIGVIGTKATIKSHAYERELLKINNSLEIIGAVSNDLVNMIENKAKNKDIKNRIKKEISVFNNKIDVLILGCTHYSWIKKDFKEALPNAYILDTEKIVAKKFKDYLNKHKEITKSLSKNNSQQIFFSKNIDMFRNKKITLMGLGLIGRGVATAQFLAKRGANITVTDLKNKEELKSSLNKLKEFKNINYVLGEHRKEDFKNADMIIQNPSVSPNSSYLKIARKNNIPIETDLTLFFKYVPKNTTVIGITGSKGKSTTTALIYKVLKSKLKEKVLLAGNLVLNKSPLNFLSKVKKNSVIILELSSWDLRNLGEYKISPNIAVVTNIIPDHLNKYKNIKEYEKDKKNIFEYQGKHDILFLNKNDKKLLKWQNQVKSKVEFFNGTNKDIACKIAKKFGVNNKDSLKIISRFNNLEHRQEFVKELRGVKFYNDSAATIPEATIKAIDDLKPKFGNLILILGGVDKNLEYKKLANKIIRNKDSVKAILLPGTASNKIIENFKKMKHIFTKVENLKQAVNEALKVSKKDDIIILSPGAASFNLFKNEFDRGNQFKKIIKNNA
ncbi:MAG: UDP-N-acetylmuramoylalanine-D-glutamate ligase [Parcubacteria group bacterium GW2011_GWA2_31_28]|nr:MAG: UDP-N-acetylmuramoylalanine-D-glutamate ligase [Parcubacteria group bacterium GW2011_GWA2_31_28]